MNKKKGNLLFYGDLFSGKGKSSRFESIANNLNSDFNVEVYSRAVHKRKTHLYTTHSSLIYGSALRGIGFLSRYSGLRYLDRNSQENIFDIWCSSKIGEGHSFMVPGLWRTAKKASASGCTLLHGVISSPSFIFKTIPYMEEEAIRWGVDFNRYKLIEEAKRVKNAIGYADAIICSSKAVASRYIEGGDIEPSKVIAMEKWLDFQVLHHNRAFNNSDSVKIVFIGTISLLKGVLRLLEVSKTLTFPHSITFFGPISHDVKHVFLREIGENKSLVYAGYGNVQRISEEYDLAIVPSYLDAEPRVIRECLTMGMRVLASSHITSIDSPNLSTFDILEGELSEAIEGVVRDMQNKNLTSLENSHAKETLPPSTEYNSELSSLIAMMWKKHE